MRLAIPFLLFSLLAAPACAEKPKLPRSEPARRLERLLKAFNTGTADYIRTFIAENYSEAALQQRSVDDWARTYLELYRNTRGLALRRIEKSTDSEIVALVQTPLTGEWYRIVYPVQPEKPYKTAGVSFFEIPTPPEFAPKGRLSDAEIALQTQTYAAKLAKAGIFSGVVLVARGSQPLFEHAYGSTGHSRATPDTLFPLASINKTFVAVAIAQLVDQGKLSFSDSIGRFYPDYPSEARDQITLHHLLTHSAGLPSFLDTREYDDAQRHGVRTVGQWAEYIGSKPLAFAPGQGYQYSNAGYLLLDGVITLVSGSPAGYRTRNIFRPLGMDHTTVEGSTAHDLLKFSVGLRTGKLLSPATLSQMASVQVATKDPSVHYGYGLEIADVNGVRVIGHAGGGPNVSAQLDMYPDLDVTVVVLSTMPSGAAQHIGNKLRDLITQR